MTILTTQSSFVGADSGTWQQHMKWAIRSVDDLLKRLDLPTNHGESGLYRPQAIQQFPVFVPLPYLERIRPGDLNDPLLAQILPTIEEDHSPVDYSADPLQEGLATLSSGLLQKYNRRVLLVTTGACAINCRYCFRRHFPYEESPKSPTQWGAAINQIAQDKSLDEVILSGGDPLTLVDENLQQLVERLDSIPHLKRMRIHTRLPIMIPQRVTDRLLEILSNCKLQPIMVIHCNHANEIDESVKLALASLATAGIILLNQSVLLRKINDQAQTLIELSQRLLESRVLPYYLHKNDPVIGTSHFEVSVERGIELINEMRQGNQAEAGRKFQTLSQ